MQASELNLEFPKILGEEGAPHNLLSMEFHTAALSGMGQALLTPLQAPEF